MSTKLLRKTKIYCIRITNTNIIMVTSYYRPSSDAGGCSITISWFEHNSRIASTIRFTGKPSLGTVNTVRHVGHKIFTGCSSPVIASTSNLSTSVQTKKIFTCCRKPAAIFNYLHHAASSAQQVRKDARGYRHTVVWYYRLMFLYITYVYTILGLIVHVIITYNRFDIYGANHEDD